MTNVSTKMKKKHEVAIFDNKHEWGRLKGKGYMIATLVQSFFCFYHEFV